MKFIRPALLTLTALSVAVAVRAADTYKLDPAHTSVNFTISHMMISEVGGRFDQVAGEVTLDNGAVTGAKAMIQVKSVDTANSRRDQDLQSPKFFDAEKFPTITFEGTTVEKVGDKTVMTGKFTMHGVTKDIQIPFKLNGPIKDMHGDQRLAVLANLTLSRKDYGMDKLESIVGDEVKITISTEAVKE